MISEMIDLLNDFFDRRSRSIIIGCIGKIEKHDLSTMRADVKPLIKYTAAGDTIASDFAVIPGIPVMFLYAGGYYIRPEYQRGDLVWVTFATHNIAQGLTGRSDEAEGATFNRESAAVVSGVAPANWAQPTNFTQSGLLVGHKDGNTVLRLTDSEVIVKADLIKFEGDVEFNGNIDVEGDVGVNGGVSATDSIESDSEIKANASVAAINLSTHTHNYTDTPAGSAITQTPNPG